MALSTPERMDVPPSARRRMMRVVARLFLASVIRVNGNSTRAALENVITHNRSLSVSWEMMKRIASCTDRSLAPDIDADTSRMVTRSRPTPPPNWPSPPDADTAPPPLLAAAATATAEAGDGLSLELELELVVHGSLATLHRTKTAMDWSMGSAENSSLSDTPNGPASGVASSSNPSCDSGISSAAAASSPMCTPTPTLSTSRRTAPQPARGAFPSTPACAILRSTRSGLWTAGRLLPSAVLGGMGWKVGGMGRTMEFSATCRDENVAGRSTKPGAMGGRTGGMGGHWGLDV
mmetsp:Transcript_51294/g.128828  ORF Transcript_51294/g.128828 Transcript_51294/m.128828 type:complete len:292 (+) Transcript_51294:1369-2244(+)